MVWWQVILFPVAILYDGITRFRNHLFNIGSTPSFDFETNVINVGNLAVGGTGKSPMVIWLVDRLLQEGRQVAILSRGYRRSTKGLRIATMDDTAQAIGDESFMYWQRYRDSGVVVAVAEERAWAIPWILTEQPDNDVIVLDDAYQHRSVTPTVNLLLTTWQRPFFKDFVMPAGRLRERRANAHRADLIIVTRSPDPLPTVQIRKYCQSIQTYASAPIMFSTVAYLEPEVLFEKGGALSHKVVAVAGLANNEPFRSWCLERFEVVQFISFGDHHRYTTKDVRRISRLLAPGVGLITTEKDAAKLRSFAELQEFPCFYVPISVSFLEGGEEMWGLISSKLTYDRNDVSEDRKDN